MGKKRNFGPPPSRRNRARATPAQQFQGAMVEGAVEDTLGAGKPCVVCQAPAMNAVAWLPTKAISIYMGAAPGKSKVIVYPICDRCQADPDGGNKAEAAVLLQHRARKAAVAAGLEIVDGVAIFTGDGDAERFREAYDSNPPPA